MKKQNLGLRGGNKGSRRVLLIQMLYYGVALLSVPLVLGINLLFKPYLNTTPTPLLFTGVMVKV